MSTFILYSFHPLSTSLLRPFCRRWGQISSAVVYLRRSLSYLPV